MTKIDFKRAAMAPFKEAGFTVRGQSLFKGGADVIMAVNFQKSDFDEKYYINFGIWLNNIEVAQFPPVNKCHIQARLTSLFAEEASEIDAACHLSATESQVAHLVGFIRRVVVPFCEDCLHLERLRVLLSEERFRKALVMKTARDMLALP